VIELFPYREERIAVPRFLCRTTGKTFSLLPCWLAPYHQYTASSIILALLLAAAAQPDGVASLFAVAEKLLEPDSRVNGFLLGRWLELSVSGLRRAHAELSRWSELDGIEPGLDVRGLLNELRLYCLALGVRGPPAPVDGLGDVLVRHSRATGRFLIGSPSQERCGRAAS